MNIGKFSIFMRSVLRFFPNYWWLIAVFWGVLHMFYVQTYEQGCIKIIGIVALLSLSKIHKITKTDLLFLLYLGYIIFGGLFKTDYHYFSLTFSIQILPMLFYVIGKSYLYGDNKFIDNLRSPMLFAMVCAILLYILQPSWYMNWKMQNWGNIRNWGDIDFYERLRLSGFWSWSYFLGYMSLFYIMLITKKYYIDNISNKFYLFELTISVLVLFFAQQRVSIAYALLFFTLIGIMTRGRKNFKLIYLIVFLLVAFVVVWFSLSYINDMNLMDYIVNRTVNKEDNLVEERWLLFKDFFNTITPLGSGLGSLSHVMLDHTRKTINDCDYLRLLNEVGFVGFSFLSVIIISSIIKGIKNISVYFFEVNILIFMLISMLGANPLEVDQLHPMMYWYCMGRIQSGDSRKHYLYINAERRRPYKWMFLS